MWRVFRVLAVVGAMAAASENAVAETLRFKDLEAVWEGGLGDGELVARGRVDGIEEAFRVVQRMTRSGDGWMLEGEISVPTSRVDFGKVLGAIPAAAEWSGDGEIAVQAEFSGTAGNWEAAGVISLRDVRLANEAMGLTIRGLNGDLQWTFAGGVFSTLPGQVLTFLEIETGAATAGPGELEFELVSPEELRVKLAVLHWAGGRLSAGDFSFRPSSPDFSVRLFATGIQLGELLAQVPELGAKGSGTIDGELAVGIRTEGLRLEGGQLSLRSEEAARLELPPRAWFTQGMAPGQGNYENLRLVERALEDLQLERFRLEFLPGGEETPDVRLQVGGRSAARDLPVTPVSLTLNVHGPVREIGNWFLGGGKVGR